MHQIDIESNRLPEVSTRSGLGARSDFTTTPPELTPMIVRYHQASRVNSLRKHVFNAKVLIAKQSTSLLGEKN